MSQSLDTTHHSWYDYFINQTSMDNNGITYKRNFKELVWYQEFIYQNDTLIGEIHTDITEDGFTQGYLLKKAENIFPNDLTPLYITNTIAYFPTVNDAKTFVNSAGTL